MRLPRKRPSGSGELRVPDLAGGLNLRDGSSEILDNQLTDSSNMWYEDGLLKTRPGIEETVLRQFDNASFGNELKEYTSNGEKKHGIYFDGEKGRMQLCSFPVEYSGNIGYREIYFYFVGAAEYKELPIIDFGFEDSGVTSYFVIEKNSILYCFLSNRSIYKLEYTKDGAVWELVTDEEKYVPTVMIHCKCSHTLDSAYSSTTETNGTMLEGYNLLSDYYKMVYSSINTSANVEKYTMAYGIIESTYADRYAGMTVKAKYTDKYGVIHDHSVELQGKPSSWFVWEDEASTDNLIMGVCGRQIRFKNADGTDAVLTKEDYVEDNLEFTLPYIPENRDEELNKIFNMTRCEWFGGASAGLAGGTRLFLSGNTDEKEKALVCWSGLNNPLYFPENSYYYVGNTSERVTGFGKQSDMLVIFKENETWYTQYYQNTDITAEDLINQSVVDIQASAVYFPLVQINPNIGCPYPDTVKLCRNRLVWLGSGGNVYTLVSESQYNERNIFCVSEMVNKKIKGEKPKASACDWNGYYCLKFWDRLYLMDYNCYGYTHIASYSKTEDANIRIPWYVWEMPDSGTVMAHNNEMWSICYFSTNRLFNDKISRFCVDLELNTDKVANYEETVISAREIECYVITKFFDFSLPHRRKNIYRVDLQLGRECADIINVTFITESGSEEQMIISESGETENTDAGYIESRALFPCIRQIRRLGIKISSEGAMAIDGMIFKYRITGSAR